MRSCYFVTLLITFQMWGALWTPSALAQEKAGSSNAPQQRVAVKKISSDKAISKRLLGIYKATGWFQQLKVRVKDGVVFLTGQTSDKKHAVWARTLAQKTEDVVAVVNKIEVRRKVTDLAPVWTEAEALWKEIIRQSPLFGIAVIVLFIFILLAKFSAQIARYLLQGRVKNQLLRTVISRVISIPILVMGLYLALRLSQLTNLAMTLIGGTSLIGLVIGFAFRDIAENFLASILLSMQRPFSAGDLIEVSGYKGFVQSVNMRSTLLMTFDGNHVQIANSKIYKETITNFSANPKIRISFTVGIGYDDSISHAQSVAMRVMQEHPAVLDDPEPSVLVEKLAASTVNLEVYCWIDGSKYSMLRVRSAIIRLVKHAFQQEGIEMPDDAREVLFPQGVPVSMVSEKEGMEQQKLEQQKQNLVQTEEELQVHQAEGNLESEEDEIQKQAENARSPESSPNIITKQEDETIP